MAVPREQNLSRDIVPLIFEQVDDLTTLSKIVEAYPSLLEYILERPFTKLVPTLLDDVWSEETLSYAYAVLQLKSSCPLKRN